MWARAGMCVYYLVGVAAFYRIASEAYKNWQARALTVSWDGWAALGFLGSLCAFGALYHLVCLILRMPFPSRPRTEEYF